MLASVSFDATTCVWERPRGEQQHELLVTLEGHESEIKDLCWSQDGELRHLRRDKSIWIWLKRSTTSSSASTSCRDTRRTSSPCSSSRERGSAERFVRQHREGVERHDDEWVCTQTLDGAYQATRARCGACAATRRAAGSHLRRGG